MESLLKLQRFSLQSSDFNTRQHTTCRHISNRLILIALFASTLITQICVAAATVDQADQAQESDSQFTCEPKTLDDVPPDPVSSLVSLRVSLILYRFFFKQYYDASDVSVNAARKLSEVILDYSKDSKSARFTQSKIDELIEQANILAREALTEDENLLAFALAAPSVKLAVVQFRDKIRNHNVTDHAFLNAYWRELGIAWNQSDGAQFWGAPFRDCGPMPGRWLWPFSVTVVTQHMK